jgi:hypothetical protein
VTSRAELVDAAVRDGKAPAAAALVPFWEHSFAA